MCICWATTFVLRFWSLKTDWNILLYYLSRFDILWGVSTINRVVTTLIFRLSLELVVAVRVV